MHLMKSDIDSNGWIKKTDFSLALEKFFPNKDDESLNLLINAADLQLDTLDSDIIPYPGLFSEVTKFFHVIDFIYIYMYIYILQPQYQTLFPADKNSISVHLFVYTSI